MAEADPRDARIAELEALVAAQAARIAELEALVRELTARLDDTSRNSHRPPSSDPPGTPPRPSKRGKSGRKRGGQPGHDGAQRQLLPPEQVDEIIELIPPCCGSCGRKLRGRDPQPLRSQVTELPRIKPRVEEYRQHALECVHCEAITRAPLPPQVVGAFGPRLVSLIVYMTGGLRLSKRVVARYLADVLGVSIADGTVCKVEQRALQALAPAVVEARQAVRSAKAVHADETGWREDKKRAWMWIFVTRVVALFVIARSRGRQVLQQTLEGFNGKLTSDRWSPYTWVDIARRQLCWSHIARDFQWMLDHGTKVDHPHAQVLIDGTAQLFRWWHKLRDGEITRRGFRRCMTPLRERMEEALAALAEHGSPKVAGKADEIWKLRQGLWTFVEHEDLEPTNNLAERQLRHAVIWRKCSYGTDSPAGSRFVEAVLTVVMTARQQDRNALELLNEYVYASFYKLTPPRLVPESCAQA